MKEVSPAECGEYFAICFQLSGSPCSPILASPMIDRSRCSVVALTRALLTDYDDRKTMGEVNSDYRLKALEGVKLVTPVCAMLSSVLSPPGLGRVYPGVGSTSPRKRPSTLGTNPIGVLGLVYSLS